LIRQIKDHLWQAHALARRIPIGTHTFGLGEPEPAYFDYRRDIAFCDRLLRTAERRTALPNREAYDKDRAASAALRIMRRYKQATPTTRRSDNRFLKLAAILCGEPDNVLGMAPAGRRAVEAGRVSTEK
jgi:hypothetical protein